MTMQHESHPHDERLAALSAADPEATGDVALREHVTGCERCRALVDDLAVLRAALAELPDLRPSRPLQLLPPVAERAAAAGGPFGLLRRLSAPAMAVGVVMILIGAVGAVGSAGSFQAVFNNVGADLGAAEPGASEAEDSWWDGLFNFGPGGAASGPSPAAAERTTPGVVATDSLGPRATYGSPRAMMTTPPPGDDEGREGDDGPLAELDSSGPAVGGLVWLALLAAGAVIAGGGLLVRFAVQPRAG